MKIVIDRDEARVVVAMVGALLWAGQVAAGPQSSKEILYEADTRPAVFINFAPRTLRLDPNPDPRRV